MQTMKRDFVVIHLALPKEIALERMMKRAEIEGRKDDTPESMQQRIDIFVHETLNVIKHFEELGKVITINAENTIENIEAELRSKLGL
jgi:adenylate kinase family enzyme